DWVLLKNMDNAKTDNSHFYWQLNEKITCRYLKVRNLEVPDGKFAISGFRIFGKGQGLPPQKPVFMSIKRDSLDRRTAYLRWTPLANTTGYVINYGSDTNKLYHSYMVYKDAHLTINGLNANQEYFFTIEAFNENGITHNDTIKQPK
ncbi:MAG: fibronectin type III domain-containing protein, partial [Bacteroidota bacterium]